MKKILTILLVCAMALIFMSISAFAATKTDFEAFDLVYSQHGSGAGNFRFIMNYKDIPFEVTATNMVNLKIEGNLETDSEKIPFSSYIKEVDLRDANFIMVVPGTETVTTAEYGDTSGNYPAHKFVVKVYPEKVTPGTTPSTPSVPTQPETPTQPESGSDSGVTKTDFDAFDLVYSQHGSGAGNFRFIMKYTDIPFEVTKTNMVNLKIEGNLETDSGNIPFLSYIKEVDLRNAEFIMVVPGTETVRTAEYGDTSGNYPAHKFVVKVYPEIFKQSDVPSEPDVPVVDPDRPDTEIAVKFNDEYMQFDVEPIMLNDRVLVPLRAIFEKLGCTVEWDDLTQTATAKRNGRIVMVTVGSDAAFVANKVHTLDQPPVMMNDRVLVPLRFVSEAFGCEVSWVDATQTVIIKADEAANAVFLTVSSVLDSGVWIFEGNSILRGKSVPEEVGVGNVGPDKNAKFRFEIAKSGTYNLWVRAKDYPNNQLGSRFFHVALDGAQQDEKIGDHNQDGFAWELVSAVDLSEGMHTLELLDTSGYFARFSGAFLTDDLRYVPPVDDKEIEKIASPYKLITTKPAIYPLYASENIEAVKTESIENETSKVVFYQGQSSRGNIVQTEIYTKDASGNWVLVKGKTEENGFLMKSVYDSELLMDRQMYSSVKLALEKNGEVVNGTEMNFYNMGDSDWLIPDDFIKTSDKEVKLYFPANEKVVFTATYSFDDLVNDPKVTIDATFNKPGDYSFGMYSGNGVTPDQYDTVTAPLYFVKHGVAPEPYMITQPAMYTPMNTLYFKPDNNVKVPGTELVSGIAVDPTCVEQRFSQPDTASYATVFYNTTGKVRPTLVAPVLGTDRCTFNPGDTYTFSYRILNRFENWYDTFEHVAVDMFNCVDLRTNYYGSVNDSIYNLTDLLMDDFYGGWNPEEMGWYNIEFRDWVSQYNFMEMAQRYRFTDNQEVLEERVIPTIAFALSRGSNQWVYGLNTGNLYVKEMQPLTGYRSSNASVWAGLYEMSQGRMPALLDIALNGIKANNVADFGTVAKYTGNEADKQAVIQKADAYLADNPLTGANRENFSGNSGAILFADYYPPVSNLLSAYEITGDKKYLDAAEEAGRYLMTVIWTTGYQNDYAENTMHIDPKETVERLRHADIGDRYSFGWHGDFQWRPGNNIGEFHNPKELYELGIKAVPEEDVPGWLATPTAHGPEMYLTPMHGNVISMNTWVGTMVRLAEYTGEDFFATQARNAIIGRYQNYPGYYIDRYEPHIYHADYPYEGPDMTSIYWHHAPMLLAQVEDFLINETWARSNGNIDFPFAYGKIDAFYSSYQFGVDSGKFYNQDDMWIWLDRGIIETDSVNVDYLPAKKDGVLGIALMNEDRQALTTTVTLGEKIPNAQSVNTTATLFDADGNQSTVEVVNGKFTVTIPHRGIVSVVIEGIDVKAPSYAQDYTPTTEVGQTVSAHVNGKGYVIQLTDDFYHAYVYISETTKDVKGARLTYTVNGETKVLENYETGLDWLIKVDDPNAEFTYSIDVVNHDGSVDNYGGGTLKTLKKSTLQGTGVVKGEMSAPSVVPGKIRLDKNDLSFEPFDMVYSSHGSHGDSVFRFVVSKKNIPFEITDGNMVHHLLLKGEVEKDGKKVPFDSYIESCEIRDSSVVFVVPETTDVSVETYTDSGKGHKFNVKICPQK